MSELPMHIVSDAEIERVHGHANFGSMSRRAVVDAFGYSSGSTQLTILVEHKLVKNPRPGRYESTLTAKGSRYLRAVYGKHFNEILRLHEQEPTTP